MNFEYKSDSDGGKADTDYEDEKDDIDSEDEKDSEDDSKDSYSDDDKDDSYYGGNFPDEIMSLQKICLKSITSNFHSFNTAYSTTKDTTLKRNLLFLQKVYSEHLISEARHRGYLNDSSLNFVINEYVKELQLGDLSKCSEEAIIKQLAKIGHGILTAIIDTEFSSSQRSVAFIHQVIARLPNIKILHIPCIAKDETLKIISSSCPHIKELYLDDCHITDEGLKSLCAETDGTEQAKCSLKTLSLVGTDVEAAGVAFLLENMPSLEVLLHPSLPTALYSVHKNDKVNNTLKTARKYNLTALDLVNYILAETSDLSDILSVCVEVCPLIKKLYTPLVTEQQFDLISQFTELENLSLECMSNYIDLNNFLTLKGGKLKEMKLSHASFSVSALLQSCPLLESLNLSDTAFQWKGEDFSNVNQLNNLHELRLENFTFSECSTEMSVGAILNSSPKLENLVLSHCEIADSEISNKISVFCSKNVVKKIIFSCSDVNLIFLESLLLSCSSLKSLIIQDCDYVHAEDITRLYAISHSKKNNVHITWDDDRSELNSLEDYYDDDDYDFHDSDHDPYDDSYYFDPYEDEEYFGYIAHSFYN